MAFGDFGSFVLHALFLAFYVFHGCRLQEAERGENNGFGPPALSRACGEALLRSVSEVENAQVVIFLGVVVFIMFFATFTATSAAPFALLFPGAGYGYKL